MSSSYVRISFDLFRLIFISSAKCGIFYRRIIEIAESDSSEIQTHRDVDAFESAVSVQ